MLGSAGPGVKADLWRLSASELLAGYSQHAFSPVEVVDAILARIEQVNPLLSAYLAVNQDDARSAAAAAELAWGDESREPPALCGLPVSVKDTIEVAGMPTTYGSLVFKNNQRADSEIARRLRQAGAIILGKTNTSEFALGAAIVNRLGPPGRNPWHLERTCGGSSGGAAAAVAVGLGPIGIGTDSGGSIRAPAAYCGVFGFKPTYQRIPSVQDWRASPLRSHNGPISRTVRDAALAMRALAGPHPRDPQSRVEPTPDYLGAFNGDVRGARVAVSRTLGGRVEPDPDALGVLEESLMVLRGLGCMLVDADPPMLPVPDELAPGVWSYAGDHYAGAEALVPNFWERHADDLTDYARPIYEAGRRALAWQYRRVLGRNQAYVAAMREWFGAYDFLVTPAAPPAPAPEEARTGKRFAYLTPFSMAHVPAAAVPSGFDASGVPLAVQVVGRWGDDEGVLRMSAALEAARPWAQHWPSVATASSRPVAQG
jgi:Asp-tRNA(Asn)/Glu-tRNA(Gln) amidotransferase A subunit family amidase